MKWEILHRTQYSYASPVRESFNELRLQPFSDGSQTLDYFLLKVLPVARLRHHHDFYSNIVHYFDVTEPHQSLLVESLVRVTTMPPPTLDLDATPWPLASIDAAGREARTLEFVHDSRFIELSADVWRVAMDATEGCVDVWQAALAIMRFVHRHLQYLPNATGVHTPMREVLSLRQGVCQDFAHLMIGLCRALKIPALYVSGYLATQSASATHAWVEVFVPGLGWRGLDPTHNLLVDGSYVKIAVGRDYSDVPPVTGHYKGTTDHKMVVDVQIRPL